MLGLRVKKTPRAGLSALLAGFGRQAKAFEPAIPKGAVFKTAPLPGYAISAKESLFLTTRTFFIPFAPSFSL